MKMTTLGLAGVMLGSMVVPMQASAGEDGKVFSASLCRQIGKKNTVSYNSAGQLYNPGLKSKSVICPITRDVVKKKWKWIKVRVRDRHYSKNVTCRAYSRNVNGAGGWSKGASTSGSSNGFKTLLMKSPGGQYNWGVYHVNCTLPGKYSGRQSGMASILLDE